MLKSLNALQMHTNLEKKNTAIKWALPVPLFCFLECITQQLNFHVPLEILPALQLICKNQGHINITSFAPLHFHTSWEANLDTLFSKLRAILTGAWSMEQRWKVGCGHIYSGARKTRLTLNVQLRGLQRYPCPSSVAPSQDTGDTQTMHRPA